MPGLSDTIFIGLFVLLTIVWFLGPALLALLQHDPEDRISQEPKAGRRFGALIAGLIAIAVGLAVLAVSLWDGVDVGGLVGAIVFLGMGLVGVVNGRDFFRRPANT